MFAQVLDGASGLAIYEVYCGQCLADRIEQELKCQPSALNSSNPVYVDVEDIAKLRPLLAISRDDELLIAKESASEDRDLVIVGWAPKDGKLPYRLHTGREPILMRNGKKPLSAFIGRIPADDGFVEIPEYLFDPYVEDGSLQKHEIREAEERPVRGIEGHRIVLYAQTGEEWRLNAYALVRFVGNKIGWSEPLIRLEGILLGYEEWQNDAYVAQMKRGESAQ